MKLFTRIAAPVLCVGLLAVGGGAFARPVVTDPLVTLAAGSGPTAVAAGPNGEFFSLNSGLDSVTHYNATGAQIGASAALLPTASLSMSMVYDQYGSLYTANPGTHSVSKVKTSDNTIKPFALPAADAPVGLALDSTRNLYVTKLNNEIARITAADAVTLTFAKLPAGSDPRGVVADSKGNIYTANFGNDTVSKVTPAGDVSTYSVFGTGVGPIAVAIDSKGMLFVANRTSGNVLELDTSRPDGAPPVAAFPLPADAAPSALVVDEFDTVFVAETGSRTVSAIVPGETTARTVATFPATAPASLAISTDDRLLIAGRTTDTISSVDLTTRIATTTIGPFTAGVPLSATVSATGVDGLSFSSGTLPTWLKLNPTTGELTGTPPAAGPVSFTVQARSAIGRSASGTISFEVSAAPSTATPAPTPTPTGAGTGGGGATTGGSGTGGASGTATTGGVGGGGAGAGTAGHGTTALASTGLGDMNGWGFTATATVLLGAVALAAARVRRGHRAS